MRRARVVLTALAATVLAGCSPNSTYGQYFAIVRQSFSASFGDGRVTRAQATQIPYASIGYRVGNGREAILVLATDTGGQQLWTAASHVVLVTRDGRVIRSVGLPANISALNPQHGDSLPPLSEALAHPYTGARIADFPNRNLFGETFSCVTTAMGPETIKILGTPIATRRVAESCSNTTQHFINQYWLDPQSRLVWRSVQYLDPAREPITIELFRPPG